MSYVGTYMKADFGPITPGIADKDAVDLFHYVQKSTGPEDVFIFRKPTVLALLGNRHASVYELTSNDRKLWGYFEKIGVTYVVVGRIFAEDLNLLGPFVARYRGSFREVHSNPTFDVYKVEQRPRFPAGNSG